ncbi:unnamed protein product, partial [Cuscuta epithymum]
MLSAVTSHGCVKARWIEIIMLCVTTVSYYVQFDKEFLGPIYPGRGLRQGDPLSPYLFILVAEGLSALMRRAEQKGDLKGISVCRGAPKVSHLLFADDCFIFFKADGKNCLAVKNILQVYEECSGQMVNFNKSSLNFSPNVGEPFKDQCCDLFEIPRDSGQKLYLGLPALVGKNKKVILGYLRDRIFSRIRSWNNRFLSRAGRAVLLKNVIQAMPTYAMNVFLLPKDLCVDIKKLMNGFWWKGAKFEQKGLRWRSWDALCKPKEAGGLGFRKIREFNLSMLAKQGWRLVTEQHSLMSRVLKAKYFPQSSFLEAKVGNNPSFIWRSIFETQNILKENIRRRVGNGINVQVWADAWLPGPGTGKITSNKPQWVSDMNVAALRDSTGTNWNRERIEALFNETDKQRILSVPISIQNREDSYWWTGEKNGSFSVKSCYRKVVGEQNSGSWEGWNKIWELHIPPKFQYFVWQVMDGTLPIVANLRKRGINSPGGCKVCGLEEEENLMHAVRSCPKVEEVWRAAHYSLGLGGQQQSIEEWLQQQLMQQDRDRRGRFVALLWCIWKRRNIAVWEDKTQEASWVVNMADGMIVRWKEAQKATAGTAAILQRGGQQNGAQAGGPRDKWEALEEGIVKINVDGATNQATGLRAWGWIARDHQGEFIKARGVSHRAEWTVEETEAMGIRDALNGAVAEGWNRVIVESDALSVVRGIARRGSGSYLELVLDDIFSIVESKSNFEVSFCKRSANHVAHTLAKAHVSSPDHVMEYVEVPDC